LIDAALSFEELKSGVEVVDDQAVGFTARVQVD